MKAAAAGGVPGDAAFAALRDVYYAMEAKLSDMLNASAPEKRGQIQDKVYLARQNYLLCRNKMLQDDDGQLVGLIEQANASTTAIQTLAGQLGNFAKVMQTLTTAVSVGTKIVARIVAV